jgi:hypothetical protein
MEDPTAMPRTAANKRLACARPSCGSPKQEATIS